MKGNFYLGFAVNNLKKNMKMVVPFILTSILAVAMFYNCINMATNDTTGTGNTAVMLNAATFLMGVFSVVFLLYTSSFLSKIRKKEYGVYSILGLEKRHIARIVVIENTIMAITSIITGLVTGILFSRLLIFALYKLI